MPKKFWKVLAFALPISILMWLLIIRVCFGAVYYVDSSITDTNPASATPDFTTYDHLMFAETGGSDSVYKTIADVNLKSFAAGDFVYFRKGQTWLEQLTIPSSGSPGSPITFGAYGSGALPIISGANIVSSWTLGGPEGGSFQTARLWTLSSQWGGTGAHRNARTAVYANSSSISGTQVRITFKAGSSAGLTGIDASIGESTTGDDYDSTPTRLTFDGGATGFAVIGTGATKITDAITFNYDKTKRYAIHLCFGPDASTSGYIAQSTAQTTNVMYLGWADVDYSQTAIWTSQSTTTNGSHIQTLELLTGSFNYYYATVTRTPLMVYEDNVRLIQKASLATMTAGSWYYDSGATTLYVRMTADDNPSGHLVEVSARDNSINFTSKNYLTIQDLFLTGGDYYGLKAITSTGIIVQRITAANIGIFPQDSSPYNNSNGVSFDGITGGLVDSCTVYNTGNGIHIQAETGDSDTVTVQFCTVHDVDLDGVLSGVSTGPNHQTTNVILQNNTAYNCAQYPWSVGPGSGIHFGGTKHIGGIIRYNISYDNGNASSEGWGLGGDVNNNGMQVYNNLSYGNYGAGITVGGSDANYVYNNTSYNNGRHPTAHDAEIYILGTAANCSIKNNLLISVNKKILWAVTGATTGHIIDYNDLYGGSGVPFQWAGTAYNFANYKITTGQDAHSLNIDPLFVNADGADFHLQPTSPCINAGVDVGLTQDYEGNPIPAKHRAVRKPDIGAYEYQYRFTP